jgi:hypothetical protein
MADGKDIPDIDADLPDISEFNEAMEELKIEISTWRS